MNNLIAPLFLLILSACSQLPKNAYVRRISVSGEAEARNVIKNQGSFLKDIFQQSHDPYYNLPKWSEACLKGNIIGEAVEKDGAIRSVSELWLKNNEAGYCPGKDESVKSLAIFEYCPGTKEVLVLKFPEEGNQHFKEKSVCH